MKTFIFLCRVTVANYRSQVEGCMSQAIVVGGRSHRVLRRVTSLAFSVIRLPFIKTSWRGLKTKPSTSVKN